MALTWVYYHTDQVAPMTQSDYENNVTIIWNYLGGALGYSANAVAAICGNMRYEGNLNPQQYQYGSNYNIYFPWGAGLCGWTPVYDDPNNPRGYNPMQLLGSWCDSQNLNWLDGDSQLKYIEYELTDWDNTERFMPNQDAALINMPVNPPITANAFRTSTLSADLLADYWLCYYERPLGQNLVSSEPYRAQAALDWYTFISGITPVPPTPPTPGRTSQMPLWMMVSRKRLYRKRRF